MTIAISMKVNDGIVLAADSASSIIERNPNGVLSVVNIYNNANKIFNLVKGKPLGVITWGSGSIGNASISTLIKDFRDLIQEEKSPYYVDINDYNLEIIAFKFKEFIFDKNYTKEFEGWNEKPSMGFMIVGYSKGEPLAEEWKIDIDNGECKGPYIIRKKDDIGITWNGEPEALCRLYLGFSTGLAGVLLESGIAQEKIDQILELSQERLVAPMVTPAMPIQDTIELAQFLVDTTIQFSKFIPGAPTVGGPIEIAAITKHEGFKWITRKHYFDVELNPNEV